MPSSAHLHLILLRPAKTSDVSQGLGCPPRCDSDDETNTLLLYIGELSDVRSCGCGREREPLDVTLISVASSRLGVLKTPPDNEYFSITSNNRSTVLTDPPPS